MASTDHEQGLPTGIPRPSRLPRAPTSTVSTTHPHDAASKTGTLPRPMASKSLRSRASGLFKDNVNVADGSRFGWHQSVGDASIAASVAEQEPASVKEIEDVQPGPLENVPYLQTPRDKSFDQKKKPRPSLSERTIETLSQIPPSPSPSRRKSSISNSMGPPPLRSPIALSLDDQSSRRRSLRHTGELMSPDKDSHQHAASPIRTVRTPSKASSDANGARLGKPPSSTTRRVSAALDSTSKSVRAVPPLLTANKMKSMHDLRGTASRQPLRKASLNFRDVTAASPINGVSSQQTAKTAAASKSKSRVSNGNTPITAPSGLKKRSSFYTTRVAESHEPTLDGVDEQSGPKSSASLRATIAKAKAAKRHAAAQAKSPSVTNDFDIMMDHSPINDSTITAIWAGSLKKRVTNALTSGTLNVAALGLKQIPDEVMQMYESNASSNVVWSEAVDLSKVIFADNEIEDIPDNVFPDWTIEELMDDDEKFNVFGGVEILDLRGNRLGTLPIGLRRLERLHTLNVSNNKLTSAVFDVICQIPNLRDLSLANNEIDGRLPDKVSQLPRLHTLDLHDNKLEHLGSALGKLESLQKLNVSGNLLSSLEIDDFKSESLTELNASRNRLSGTFFTGETGQFGRLQELNVSSNQLLSLCDTSLRLPQLQSLVVDNNQLRLLPDLSGVPKLTTLTVSENRLEEVPEAFVTLQVLRSANFSGNNLKILDPYISRMDNLTILNIGGNPLRDRKYLSMSTADLKLELAKRLTAVLVTSDAGVPGEQEITNDATESAETASDVLYKSEKGTLDLSNQKLTIIDPSQVDLSKDVHTIQMSGNAVSGFPIDLLIHPSVQHTLQHLDISRNSTLDSMDYLPHPIYLPSLRTLQISNTSLASLDPLTNNLSAPALQELNISGHRLTGSMPHLKFSFPNLTRLIAADNRFDTITVDAIRGLEVVDIRNNEIEALAPKIGELGNVGDRREAGRLRAFEVSGNRFRVPRLAIIEKGTEAILADLRRMVNADDVGEEWLY